MSKNKVVWPLARIINAASFRRYCETMFNLYIAIIIDDSEDNLNFLPLLMLAYVDKHSDRQTDSAVAYAASRRAT